MANLQSLLGNLHTFNVAARTLSFTEAAKLLHLTQGAVSHRIKVLEQELGFNLFVRGTRKLTLTEEGRRFQGTLASSLNNIFSEIDDIRHTELSGDLTIATSPGIAYEWLIPRLADFKAKYPKFNLKVMTQELELDFETNNIDVALYYGASERPDVYRIKMFDERYVPVCTPTYAKENHLFEDGMNSLSRVNFLYAATSTVWSRWAKHHKVDIDITRHCSVFTHQDMAVFSARKGLGVAMGRYRFVKDALESGELVSPYPGMETHKTHDLLCPLGSEKRPKVRTFINWVTGQINQTN
ncbi:transcriptional regulator [Grimontia sp. AD028]|uniref:LysR substrate-binding domain-containing protein n=1 Tax=Grimontia sp. AD028 TaxID=1581149 RepID=UPI00061AA51C|nr:LysR substrate-binding domain-containing protein [Grimontia sp. AD028]KKD60413.1 transcriptional regulator [Grimontia sp. AD028]